MSQHDYLIADQNGLSFLADLNAALAAIQTTNSGTEPAVTRPYMLWADSVAGVLKIRNAEDNAWVSLMLLATGVPLNLGIGSVVQAYSAVLSGIVAGTTPLSGFRNVIINGNFQVNQRAYVSGAAVGTNLYGHDRWKMAASADTYAFSTSQNVTTVTIPAGKVLRQVIEGVELQSGTYTLSWEGTAQGKIGAGVYGASGITGTVVGGTNLTIEFGSGTLGKAQLEFGSIPTPFENRPLAIEERLCQRYLPSFSASEIGAPICSGYSSATTTAVGVFPFVTTPRVAPTGVTTSAASSFSFNNSAVFVASGISFGSASTLAATIVLTVSGATANQGGRIVAATAAAKLLFTGCEL